MRDLLQTAEVTWLESTVSSACLIAGFQFKLANDKVIVGIINDDESKYSVCVDELVDWNQACFLPLNTKKTKEMILERAERHTNK